MLKCLFKLFNYKDSLDAQDDNQRAYREAFGIVDRYLLNYESDKFIVYIDKDYDIDWVENTDFNGWTEEEKSQFYANIEKLDRAQAYPCMLLSKKYKVAFLRILGTAYVAVFHKAFEGVDTTIVEAKRYVKQRNLEKARQIYLTCAGFITLLAIIYMFIRLNTNYVTFSTDTSVCCVVMGITGAYFSIWQRYEDLLMKGFSTHYLLGLESISRLFIGGISAIVVYLAYKCQIVFTLLGQIEPIYAISFLGFLGGMCERFVPSLVESFANKNLNEE